MSYVYHGSHKEGLEVLEPRVSTHGKPYVYATTSEVIATLFLSGYGGDFTCQIGYSDDKLIIVERYKGALTERYENKSGYIYVCDSQYFKKLDHLWIGEVISEISVPVLKSIKVNNILDKILEYENLNEIKVYRYPERPSHIPLDNSDLIEKVLKYYLNEDVIMIDRFEKVYPDLAKKVRERINK